MVVTRCDWFVTLKKASVSFSESFTSLMKTWSDQKCWKNDLKAQMFTLRASKIWIIWRQSSECLCKKLKFWLDVGSTQADRNKTDRAEASRTDQALKVTCSLRTIIKLYLFNPAALRYPQRKCYRDQHQQQPHIHTQLLIHGQWEERRTQSRGGRETASNKFQLHGRKTTAYISLRSLKWKATGLT